eukprot:scaffold6934_cov100-Cylindrotheca_fusiformis.AAC.3
MSGQPRPYSSTVTVDTRAELEHALLQRNQERHFSQAEGTPFTRQPFSNVNSDNQFRLPTPLPPGLFHETQAVVDILQDATHNPPQEWSKAVTFQQFLQEGLKAWRESTSTSPSGRHIGLYKALLVAYYNESGEFAPTPDDSRPAHSDQIHTGPTTQDLATDILDAIYTLAAMATANGYSLH